MAIWDDVIPEDERELLLNTIYRSGPLPYGARPVLLVVDMTNAFVTDDYPTGWAATGKPAADAIKQLLPLARQKGVPVVYTAGRVGSLPAERGYWKDSGSGLDGLQNPHRHSIYSELQPLPGEPILPKSKPSAFFGTDLQSILVYHHADTLIVTGMVTSGCIRATVLDAFNLNYVTMVPQECVADRSQVSHKVSLFDLHSKYADVVSLAQVVEYLSGVQPITTDQAAPTGMP